MQRYYGVDLLDMWRGRVSMRRISVLVRGLPAGSGLHQLRGGDLAWSPAERAVRESGWMTRSTLIACLGGKGARQPSPPSPPPEGWWEKRQRAIAKEARKVERLRKKSAQAQANQQFS